jgi:hypothetical protein
VVAVAEQLLGTARFDRAIVSLIVAVDTDL